MDMPKKIWAWDAPHAIGPTRIWSYEEMPSALTAEYIRADLVPQWQPVETAPKDGSRFLMYVRNATPHNRVRVGMWLGRGAGWVVYGWKDTHGNFHEPTLWQPLPEPPCDE